MSRIYWDTMLFVYWLEDHPKYGRRVLHILSRMQERGDELCTSAFSLAELLVGPYKQGASEVSERIRSVFEGPEITVLPFTTQVADQYARIRAQMNVSPADAIHLACAADADTDLFLSNDAYLVGKSVRGIKFIAGIDTDLF
jgi:predicted nucleic acid-binding protein